MSRRFATGSAVAVTGLAAAGVLSVAVLFPGPRAEPARPPGDATAGAALFEDRCSTCHVAEGGGQGPSLAGVYGRKAGSREGFAYSAALKGSGLVWTGPTLDRFLADPRTAVPGTAMPIAVPDAKERADIIAYLASRPAN